MKHKKRLLARIENLEQENSTLRIEYRYLRRKMGEVDPLLLDMLCRVPKEKLGHVASVLSLLALGIEHTTRIDMN